MISASKIRGTLRLIGGGGWCNFISRTAVLLEQLREIFALEGNFARLEEVLGEMSYQKEPICTIR